MTNDDPPGVRGRPGGPPDTSPEPTASRLDAADAQAAGPGGAAGPRAGAGDDARRAGAGKRRSFWKELPVLIALALVLALLVKTYVVQAFFIPSGSMQNTLNIDDKILVNKFVYHFRSIHRGDIIVFSGDGSWLPPSSSSPDPLVRLGHTVVGLFGLDLPDDDFVKRVIGLPGDHVACCNASGLITVNGVALHESSYLYPGNSPSSIPYGSPDFSVIVPRGHLWVMGDHRQVSVDSRLHRTDPGGGSIPESAVVGRAFMIVWPPSRWRFLPIPATFQQPALNAAAAAAPATPLAVGLLGAAPLAWACRRSRRRSRQRLRRRPER
jgi:signal peptidase I